MSKRSKILAVAAAIFSTILVVAAGATFRDAEHVAPKPSPERGFDEQSISTKKGDRLPLAAPMAPSGANAQTEAASLAASPAQLPPATEDDIRQADAEHHRHRDMCPHGKTYFMKEHHQYWRCKL